MECVVRMMPRPARPALTTSHRLRRDAGSRPCVAQGLDHYDSLVVWIVSVMQSAKSLQVSDALCCSAARAVCVLSRSGCAPHRAGLIQIDDGWVAHEGDGDAEAAFHAAAVLARLLVSDAVQVHRSQASVDSVLQLLTLPLQHCHGSDCRRPEPSIPYKLLMLPKPLG